MSVLTGQNFALRWPLLAGASRIQSVLPPVMSNCGVITDANS